MKITNKEGEFLTEQEILEAKQGYAEQFSESDSFLEFMIVGKKFAKSLLSVEEAKGLRVDIGVRLNEDTGKMQLYPILRAVTKFGNILPYPETLEIDESAETELKGMQIMGGGSGTPLKCPVACT